MVSVVGLVPLIETEVLSGPWSRYTQVVVVLVVNPKSDHE